MAATTSKLGELHEVVAQELLNRVRSGEASAADIANALKMLKDNGVEARGDKNPTLGSLAREFPVFDQDSEYAN